MEILRNMLITSPDDYPILYKKEFFIYKNKNGYTPYKAGTLFDSYDFDFWFSHYKNNNIGYIPIELKDEANFFAFWLTLDNDGLKVCLLNLKYTEINDIRDQIIKHGILILSKPEFNIHSRRQKQLFYKE